MEIPVTEYLEKLLLANAEDSGRTAQYIPELADADPDRLAVAFATPDGRVYCAGDVETEFTIQSISKPFSYALAIADRGLPAVLEHVDVEPSGDAFNEISLDPRTGRPMNPMINAGAIAVHGLLDGEGREARSRRVVDFYSRLAGRRLEVDERVHASELAEAHRNLAIAHMLKSLGTLAGDPAEVVDGYTWQCSVKVTVRDLARMAAVLASGGRDPHGSQLISPSVNRQVLSVMTTCGMYDSSGEWLTQVGIPAKSGVSGGLLGVLPGQGGLAAFSPRLDAHGNSVRGIRIFEQMNRHMGLHLMDSVDVPRLVNRRHVVQGVPVHEVTGDLRFVEAERVMRSFETEAPGPGPVVVDLTRVHRVKDIARRVLLESLRRLHLDGHDVRLVDPDEVLGSGETGHGEIVDGAEAEGGYVPRRFPDVVSAVAGA